MAWSEDWAVIGGERTKPQVAHSKLLHSRTFIVRAYPLQTHEMLFDALTQAFRVLEGVVPHVSSTSAVPERSTVRTVSGDA